MLFPVCGFDMILASTHPSKAFSRSLSVVKGDRFLTNNLAEGWPVPLDTKSSVVTIKGAIKIPHQDLTTKIQWNLDYPK